MIAILREHRRAATVMSDKRINAMRRTTAGGRLRAITTPSANQQTAVRRGARRNSSGDMRATAFGQRSGFGALTLPVFEALPADRTHEPFHHKVTAIICAKSSPFRDETFVETYRPYESPRCCSRPQPATLRPAQGSPDHRRRRRSPRAKSAPKENKPPHPRLFWEDPLR